MITVRLSVEVDLDHEADQLDNQDRIWSEMIANGDLGLTARPMNGDARLPLPGSGVARAVRFELESVRLAR